MTKTFFRAFVIFLFVTALTGTAFAQTTNPYSADPLKFVNQLFQMALGIGGLLAFGSIVYGGFKYTVAAGNPGGQSDAKDRITQALIGLLLLVGSVLILNTINPAITNTKLPALSPIKPLPLPGDPGAACAPPGCGQGSYCNNGTCAPLICASCLPPNQCGVSMGQPACLNASGTINHCTPGDPFYYCGTMPVTNCFQPCAPPNTCTFRGSGAGGGPDYRCTNPDGATAF
jgi:hypothetical protein